MENDKLVKASDVKEYFKRVIFGADQKIDAWVDSIPAVDAVEVVRCRECRHGLYSEHYGNVVCSAHLWTRGPRYFCGDGQRREDGDA